MKDLFLRHSWLSQRGIFVGYDFMILVPRLVDDFFCKSQVLLSEAGSSKRHDEGRVGEGSVDHSDLKSHVLEGPNALFGKCF
jgi:hypothetical protein